MPILEPSVSMRNGSVSVGIRSAGACVIFAFNVSKASWHVGVHSKGIFSDVRALSGRAVLANPSMNLR